jgi:hypothetical protein
VRHVFQFPNSWKFAGYNRGHREYWGPRIKSNGYLHFLVAGPLLFPRASIIPVTGHHLFFKYVGHRLFRASGIWHLYSTVLIFFSEDYRLKRQNLIRMDCNGQIQLQARNHSQTLQFAVVFTPVDLINVLLIQGTNVLLIQDGSVERLSQ